MQAHLNLAIALEKHGRYVDALEHYQRSYALNPGQLPDKFENKLSQLRSKTAASQKGPIAAGK